jgi:hypothetical protein
MMAQLVGTCGKLNIGQPLLLAVDDMHGTSKTMLLRDRNLSLQYVRMMLLERFYFFFVCLVGLFVLANGSL